MLRCARNDVEVATQYTVVIPRAGGGSSTPRLIGSITAVSGILDHPPQCAIAHKAGDDSCERFAIVTSVPVLQPADMLLRIELEPDALDQIKLGFEEVDVMFLVLHQLLEQVA